MPDPAPDICQDALRALPRFALILDSRGGLVFCNARWEHFPPVLAGLAQDDRAEAARAWLAAHPIIGPALGKALRGQGGNTPLAVRDPEPGESVWRHVEAVALSGGGVLVSLWRMGQGLCLVRQLKAERDLHLLAEEAVGRGAFLWSPGNPELETTPGLLSLLGLSDPAAPEMSLAALSLRLAEPEASLLMQRLPRTAESGGSLALRVAVRPAGGGAPFPALLRALSVADGGNRVLGVLERLGDQTQAPEYELTPRTAPRRVLIADDDPVNRRLAAMLLGRMGNEVTAVEGGREALEAMAGADFDLVLLDLEMPELDGLATVSRMRQLERMKAAPRTVILALTGHSGPEERDLCREAGMDGLIVKPLSLEALHAWLQPEDQDDVPPGTTSPGAGAGCVRQKTPTLDNGQNAARPVQQSVAGVVIRNDMVAGPFPPAEIPEPAAMERDAPSVDVGVLLERLHNNRGFMSGVLRVFQQDAPARLAAIQECRDPEEMALLCRSLAGMAAEAGAVELGRVCREMMRAARGGDLRTAEAMSRDCARELEETLESVRRTLAGMSGRSG